LSVNLLWSWAATVVLALLSFGLALSIERMLLDSILSLVARSMQPNGRPPLERRL